MQTVINEFDNEITLIYGQPATGKTTVALMAAIKCCKENKVIFIDTENSFNIERFKQLKGTNKDLDNIFIVKPVSFEDQLNKVENLTKIKSKSLVIVDSLGFHYRLNVKEDYKKANDALHRQMSILNQISKEIPVILTNQVSYNIDKNKNEIVGGPKLKNWAKKLIRLEKSPRRLILEKPELKEFKFEINNDG